MKFIFFRILHKYLFLLFFLTFYFEVCIKAMIKKLKISPIRGKLLDVNKFIKKNMISEVTSLMIYEPNTTSFHPEGLFSEKIFGGIMSEERYYKFGYISLNTDVIQPMIYDILKHLKSTYVKIMNGMIYVKIDNKTNQFIIVDRNEEGANTGYNFFLENIYKISLDPVNSDIKKEYINTFNKYQKAKLLTCDKLIVNPAGLREIINNARNIAKDDINNIYMSILAISQSLPTGKVKDDIYDSIRFTIQKKIHEIYDYFFSLLEGKKKFVKDKLGNRQIAFGTRNVLSIDVKNCTSPNDLRNLKPHEVKISLYQTVKEFQPFVLKYIKDFFSEFIDVNSITATVLDEKTYMPIYISISNIERDKYIIIEKLENIINNFKYQFFKNSQIKISNIDGKKYPISFVYKDKRNIYFSNNIESLEEYIGKPIIRENISILTWAELVYIILCKHIYGKKYSSVTRYPVIQPESIKPLLVKGSTTIKSEKRFFIDMKTNETIIAPEYPIIGEKYIETIAVNQMLHKGFGSDVDGDMLNSIGIWSDDGNQELKDFNSDISSLLDDNYNFQLIEDDTSRLVIKNLSI